MTDPTPPSTWFRCPKGHLIAESHLATMVVRGCPVCGSHTLEPASELHARLGEAGAVKVTTFHSSSARTP